MRLSHLTARRLAILAGVLAVAIAALCALRWHAYRVMLRHEIAYNDEMEHIYKDFERRLRVAIARRRQTESDGHDGAEATDRLFELLQLSAVAAHSREVEAWRKAPHPADRAAVALKWAEVAADESAYEGELHERWRRDCESGRLPHHITAREVEPFPNARGLDGRRPVVYPCQAR